MRSPTPAVVCRPERGVSIEASAKFIVAVEIKGERSRGRPRRLAPRDADATRC
jgi:hypothetical protein